MLVMVVMVGRAKSKKSITFNKNSTECLNQSLFVLTLAQKILKVIIRVLGPVVRKAINGNPHLKVNRGFHHTC